GVGMPRHHGRKQPAYYWAVHCAVAAEPSSHPETGLDLTNVRMSIPSQVDVAAGEPGYLDVGEHGCTPSGELPELNEHSLVTPARRVLLEKNGENERRALRLDAEAGVEVDGERDSLAPERRLGYRPQQLQGADGQVETKGAQQLSAPEAGADHYPLGLDFDRALHHPPAARPLECPHRPLLPNGRTGGSRRSHKRGDTIWRRDASVAGCPGASQEPLWADPWSRLDQPLCAEHVHLSQAHLGLQTGGLLEPFHDLHLPRHEEVSALVERDWRADRPPSRLPELEAASRELDLERGAELLTDTTERATGRAAGELVLLHEEDCLSSFLRQVVRDSRANDAAADDDRLEAFHSCGLPDPTSLALAAGPRLADAFGESIRRSPARMFAVRAGVNPKERRCSHTKARRRWSPAPGGALDERSRWRSPGREPMWQSQPGASTSWRPWPRRYVGWAGRLTSCPPTCSMSPRRRRWSPGRRRQWAPSTFW